MHDNIGKSGELKLSSRKFYKKMVINSDIGRKEGDYEDFSGSKYSKNNDDLSAVEGLRFGTGRGNERFSSQQAYHSASFE